MYIWYAAQCHNINNYVDQIKCETDIVIDPSKILGHESCIKNAHFLSSNPKKPIFHQNLVVFFSKYLDARVGNTLLVDNTLYKSLFDGPYNVNFVKTFNNFIGNKNNYLLGDVLPYLEALQSSRLNVRTFVENNPFSSIKHISRNDPKYKMLFEDCGGSYVASYRTKERMKMKKICNWFFNIVLELE